MGDYIRQTKCATSSPCTTQGLKISVSDQGSLIISYNKTHYQYTSRLGYSCSQFVCLEPDFSSSMTAYEEVFAHFNMSNATANYHRIGHADEIMVETAQGEVTGEDYLNANHPAGDYSAYEEFLKQSDKIPMCTASKGNVFSLANAGDNGEPDPQDSDPYYGSHMTDVILPPIVFNEQNPIEQCSRSLYLHSHTRWKARPSRTRYISHTTL